MRAHNRKDFEYIILKGKPHFTRGPCYACVITQSTAYPDVRCIYHVELFYNGDDGIIETGVQTRARAKRYGSAIVAGKRRVGGYRNMYIPTNFPKLDIPTEDKIEIR